MVVFYDDVEFMINKNHKLSGNHYLDTHKHQLAFTFNLLRNLKSRILMGAYITDIGDWMLLISSGKAISSWAELQPRPKPIAQPTLSLQVLGFYI